MTDSASGLRLGLVLPPCPNPEELSATVACADESGLHSLWVTDRTVAGMPWLDGLTLLGALAATTRRVEIGTSVLVLSRRNPVHVAHALATVEYLSGGRLIAGIGVGNTHVSLPEFEIAGVDPAQRGRLTDEYVGLLRRLWSEEEVDHVGDGWRCSKIGLLPRPARQVPVWIGGSSPASRRRAGRIGDGWLSVFSSPKQHASQWAEVQAAAEASSRAPAAIVPGTYLFGAIGTDGDASRQLLDRTLQGFLNLPLTAVADSCVWGTPEQWLERLAEWHDAGAQHVNVALFSNQLERDARLVAEHVVPHLARPARPT
ncbi:LLM class flavin-dependent oxidoreductase [Streptomyces krungchingensis]